MRTQAEAMAYIKKQDPDTALTPWALRTMVLTGRIPSIEVGKKRLINLDTLSDYLCPEQAPVSETDKTHGDIRPIEISK